MSELLTEANVLFQPDFSIIGRSGREWRIDYRTDSAARTAMVSVLTTGSRSAAHRITEHTLAGWVDLHHLKAEQPELAFVSLFDDTADVWREEDFKMVDEWSEIGLVSHPDDFVRMLQAA